MPFSRWMKFKVCLVGKEAVGKTSLVRRFVLDQFDDRYIVTLGAKVSKKVLHLPAPDGNGSIEIDITIWDIMGSKAFRELLREAYFHGAQGIVAVCDVTNRESLQELSAWAENVFATVGPIPAVIAVNKADLRDQGIVKEEEIKREAQKIGAPYFYTSARTGENVEELFQVLMREVLAKEHNAVASPAS